MTFKFKLIIFSGHSSSLPTGQKHKHEFGDGLETVPGSEWERVGPGIVACPGCVFLQWWNRCQHKDPDYGEFKTSVLTSQPPSWSSRFSFRTAWKKKKKTCIETEMARWETVGTLRKMEWEKEKKEGIKRNGSEVRWAEGRDFSEREHKATPRSLRHTGFDTPTASSWPPPARRMRKVDGLFPELSFHMRSTNCNKNSAVWVANTEQEKCSRDPRYPA